MNRNVVLAGGGHAHLFVVSQAEEFRSAGVNLTLIDPGMLWYSGMATGMLGGIYTPEQDQVNLQAFCKRNQVEFHKDKAVALDRKEKTIRTGSDKTIQYDLLSLDVGSTVDMRRVNDPDSAAWTVKPIPGLLDLQAALKNYSTEERPCSVGVIGGGPTGAEIAANVQAFCNRIGCRSSITLMHGGERLLSSFPEKAASTLAQILAEREIDVQLGTEINQLQSRGGKTVAGAKDGRELEFDEVIIATGLVPSDSVRALGLGDNGLAVNNRLMSLEDESIFGAGDCISFTERALPKVGVFGVREAPILKNNLLSSLTGKNFEAYEPQEKFLIILNLGDGTGLAIRGNWLWRGRLAFLAKNFIDTRFMKKYKQAK
ncbi:MAG: NAD(P)/FAD-dependent oxidoreductase [Verrucomicrobiota bacterium]